MKRCDECGSWGAQCSSDTPVKDCGCARCANARAAAERKLADMMAAAIDECRLEHYYCDGDPWFSCPMHPEGCINEALEKTCNCGADAHNAKIDAALDEWRKARGETK